MRLNLVAIGVERVELTVKLWRENDGFVLQCSRGSALEAVFESPQSEPVEDAHSLFVLADLFVLDFSETLFHFTDYPRFQFLFGLVLSL